MKEKLNKYEKTITAQHGEDGILEYLLGVIGDKIVKIACEVGAHDGKTYANTYTLWHDQGWKAVLIEGNPKKYAMLLENSKGKDVLTLDSFIKMRGEGSLDDIHKKNKIGPEIGVLIIDIDSFDYHVWKNLDYLKPQIVFVEHSEKIPPHIEYYDPEDEVFLKCSAKSLETLGKEKGYKLVCCTVLNSIFVRDDLFDPEKMPDMPVEWLFDYSELGPHVIFPTLFSNRVPVFSKPMRNEKKVFYKLIYRLQALFKKRVNYKRPSEATIKHIKSFGLDI